MTTFSMKIDKNNRVVLPLELREKLGVSVGAKLYAVEDEETGEINLKTWPQLLESVQRAFAPYFKDYKGSLVDELIADRREEARREMEEL